MRILVSACLLGLCCRYDGGSKPCPAAMALREKGHELIPVCPEQLGGLPTPRTASERIGDRIMSVDGLDRTTPYRMGAEQAAKVFELLSCDCALLKARSPMCGKSQIYDGTFSGKLTEGHGVLAELLLKNGAKVYSENEIEKLC